MSFTDFISDNGRRINKENFIHLVQIAQADGTIDKRENELLHLYGRKFSLTNPEIDSLIKSEESHIYAPPYELEKRFEHLYDVMQIMLSDGKISNEERNFFTKLAIAASFKDETIPFLIDLLSNGISEGKDEEDLLAAFRKSLRK